MPHVTFGTFSLAPPQDWTLSTVILAGPPDEGQIAGGVLTTKRVRPFQRNLIVTMERVAAGETPESYRKRQTNGLIDAGVSWQKVGKPEDLKLQGRLPGLLAEQIMPGPGGERVRQMQLICIKDGLAYTIIASHLDGAPFESAREEFRGMLLSFS